MLIALAGLQTACGFHPRGVVGLPGHITPVYLDLSETDDELGRELQASLLASDENDLAASSTDAKTVLHISDAQKTRRVVAVDNLGRAREYEINYQFRYELKIAAEDNAQSEVIKAHTITLKRNLLFDPDSVLAVDYENEALYKDMRKEAARTVLRQLSAIKQPSSQQN